MKHATSAAKFSLFGFSLMALLAVGLGLDGAFMPSARNGRTPASASLDFNQMIEESQKNTAELNVQFQKSAGIQKKILNAGKISEEHKEIPVAPEQFAAKSSSEIFANTHDSKIDEKAEMKRLSQELQEVEN